MDVSRVNMKTFEKVQHAAGDFGPYQVRVFLVTQFAYLAITGSMLCTIYDTLLPSDEIFNCSDPAILLNDSVKAFLLNSIDFHSLLIELDLFCAHNYIPTFFQTSVMVGGVIGAVVCGFLADRYGRRPVNIGTLAGCLIMNLVIGIAGSAYWTLSAIFMFMLGFTGGGYMVVNLVLLLEVVGTQYWRLGVTAFNGWPLGLMFMAALGYITNYWRWYHLCLATVAFLCLVPLWLGVHESARWLVQHDRNQEATQIMLSIAAINGRTLTDQDLQMDQQQSKFNSLTEQTSQIDEKLTKLCTNDDLTDRKYSYLDLAKHRRIFIHLMALLYSWLASSIISFGIYFNMGHLAGNRFLNTFLLGLFKGITGIIPFLVAKWVGRKPVLVVSVVVACFSCWAAVGVFFFDSEHGAHSVVLTVFSVLGASAIDPIWKVNHLYSTELFPTVVRNMARGVCNAGSRIGSVIAPQVAYLQNIGPSIPYVIFGSLAIIQLIISIIFLPETKDQPLPDRLDENGFSGDLVFSHLTKKENKNESSENV